MEFTQEQISEIISEITNGHQGLDGLVKQGLEIGGGWFVWLTTTRSGWRKRIWKKSDFANRGERKSQRTARTRGYDISGARRKLVRRNAISSLSLSFNICLPRFL